MLKPAQVKWWAPLWKRGTVVALIAAATAYCAISGNWTVAAVNTAILAYLIGDLFITFPYAR